MDIILLKMPLPPSVNQYLAVVRGRLIKTKVFRDFLSDFIFRVKSDPSYKHSYNKIKGWIDVGLFLQVDTAFVWKKDDIFTKGDKAKHKIKKKDHSNRVKPLHDALSESFDFDDMYIFGDSGEKVTDDDCDDPYCMIKIYPVVSRTIKEWCEDV